MMNPRSETLTGFKFLHCSIGFFWSFFISSKAITLNKHYIEKIYI